MNLIPWNEPDLFLFFFVLVRVTAFLFFLPLLGDRHVLPSIKVLLGLALAVMVFPGVLRSGVHLQASVMESNLKLVAMVAAETVFGMAIGYIARWVFDAVQFAGNLSGTTMGYSMASVLDPHTESQTIAAAELHYVMAAMLFLAMNGHHFYLSAMATSFQTIPVGIFVTGHLAPSDSILQYFIRMTGEVFVLAVKMAAPILIVVLLSNLTFSMVARAVSQMNVLVMSFIANLVVGLAILVISLPGISNLVQDAFETQMDEVLKFMRLLGG